VYLVRVLVPNEESYVLLRVLEALFCRLDVLSKHFQRHPFLRRSNVSTEGTTTSTTTKERCCVCIAATMALCDQSERVAYLVQVYALGASRHAAHESKIAAVGSHHFHNEHTL
jgi:hypothetical protein